MKLNNKLMGTVVMTIAFIFFLVKVLNNPAETIQQSIPLGEYDSSYTLISLNQTRTHIVELDEDKKQLSSKLYAGRLLPFVDEDHQSKILVARKKVYLYEQTSTSLDQLYAARHAIFFTNLIKEQELYYVTRITDIYLFCHMDDCTYFSNMNLSLDEDTLQFTSLNVLDDMLYMTTINTQGEHVVYLIDLTTKQFVSKHTVAGDLFVHDQQLYALKQTSQVDDTGVSTLVFDSEHVLLKYDPNLKEVSRMNMKGLSEGYLSYLNSDANTMYFLNTLHTNETELIAYNIDNKAVINKVVIPSIDDAGIKSSDIMFDFVAHKITFLSAKDTDGYTYRILDFKFNNVDTITSKERLVNIVFH